MWQRLLGMVITFTFHQNAILLTTVGLSTSSSLKACGHKDECYAEYCELEELEEDQRRTLIGWLR